MPLKESLRFLFVVNPISGGNAKADVEEIIRRHFQGTEHVLELYELKGEHDHTSLEHWIKDWKPDRVIAVGGDGTLKLVAEQVIDTKISIGLLPAGSANGMAKDLGIPLDLEACMDIITEGREEWIDVIRINDKEICLHLSDIGLNAHMIKYFEEGYRRGKWGYAREMLRVLVNKKLIKAQITTGNKRIMRKAFMIVLANARMYGTGAMINPDGKLDDGLLEVVILRRISLWEVLKMFLKYGRFNPKKTEVVQAEEVTISSKKAAYFQVDGEYRGKLKTVHAKVHRNALRILLPRQ